MSNKLPTRLLTYIGTLTGAKRKYANDYAQGYDFGIYEDRNGCIGDITKQEIRRQVDRLKRGEDG